MLTEAVTGSVRGVARVMQVNAQPGDGAAQKSQETARQSKGLDLTQVKAVAEDVEKNLNLIHNVDLRFSVHEGSGDVMVTVFDETTGKVIRQIPPPEVLELAAKFDDMIGLLFDKKG